MDVERARELLAAERRRLERALTRRVHQDDGEESDQQHASNLAADLYQAEFDEGLAEDLDVQLAAVERAEQRLAAGTYGLSIESGHPISDERLEAWPTAERTTVRQAPAPRPPSPGDQDGDADTSSGAPPAPDASAEALPA